MFIILLIDLLITCLFLLDDYGWKVRGQHLGAAEKCDPRNPEKEQFGAQFRGAVPERVHDGVAQARREALHRPQGGRDATPGDQSEGRRPSRPPQQFLDGLESGLERPSDFYGHDTGYFNVHGQSLRAAKRRR